MSEVLIFKPKCPNLFGSVNIQRLIVTAVYIQRKIVYIYLAVKITKIFTRLINILTKFVSDV